MKNLFILILVLLIFSCDIAIIPDFWSIDNDEYLGDITIDEIIYYTQDHCKYTVVQKYGKRKYAQTPQESFDRGKGDCIDRATLAIALIYKYKEIKSELCLQEKHAYIKVNGTSYWKKSNVIDHYQVKFDSIPYWISGER